MVMLKMQIKKKNMSGFFFFLSSSCSNFNNTKHNLFTFNSDIIWYTTIGTEIQINDVYIKEIISSTPL